MEAFLSAGAVSLILWAVSFLYFRSYLSRRTSAQRVLSEFRDEVDKLVAEIDAATDRDVQLVEDRMKALRALLDEAEKRVGTMRREVERRSSEERAYAELGKRARPLSLFPSDEAPAPPPAARPEPREPASLQEPALSPTAKSTAGREFRTAPEDGESKEARFIRAQMQIAPKEPPFAERVAELSRAGFSAEIIAARLGKTVGEVDLAIALNGKVDRGDGDHSGN